MCLELIYLHAIFTDATLVDQFFSLFPVYKCVCYVFEGALSKYWVVCRFSCERTWFLHLVETPFESRRVILVGVTRFSDSTQSLLVYLFHLFHLVFFPCHDLLVLSLGPFLLKVTPEPLNEDYLADNQLLYIILEVT